MNLPEAAPQRREVASGETENQLTGMRQPYFSVIRFQYCGGILFDFVTLDLSIHEKKSTSDQSEMWPRHKKSAKCELTVCRLCQLHTKSKWK